ncbi:MAG: hypothetical protein HY581_05935 [Nitrospirae bacterium]|nr:hypothetical protein [Nitrospirota bacterium]
MRALFHAPLLLISLIVVLLAAPAMSDAAERPEDKPERVPPEEYPIYDQVVQDKFLTSETTLVIIERLTATRLGPEEKEPPSRAYFEENRFFEGRLQPDLVTDFILKTVRPFRLEARFNFGVSYRFVSGGELEGPEVSLAPIPAAFSPADLAQAPRSTIGVLEFSRVGFSPRRDQALVYVSDDRPDGTGAGFLMLLRRAGREWKIVDTQVLWVARHEDSPIAP